MERLVKPQEKRDSALRNEGLRKGSKVQGFKGSVGSWQLAVGKEK
jgi:hypothetical protein